MVDLISTKLYQKGHRLTLKQGKWPWITNVKKFRKL